MVKSRVGILELKDDPFIIDVISRLSDLTVEFLSFADWKVPVTSDYRVVVDRLSYRSSYLKEIVRNMALDGSYVINNPFTVLSSNKLVDELIFRELGIPSPKSMVLPGSEPKEELGNLFTAPSWQRIIDEVGLPCVLKPVDGYGWDYVYMINTQDELKLLYTSAGMGRVWLVQQKINYRHYYRAFCIDKKDVLFIKWIPRPFGAGEYLHSDLREINDIKDTLIEKTLKFNKSLDMDINTMEWCVDEKGQPWVIDAFNEVPDMPKSRMPSECYWWIVDRFTACIREKFTSGRINRHCFDLPAGT